MSTTAEDLYSELEAKAQAAPAAGSYAELEAQGSQADSADPYSELEARAGGVTIPPPSSSTAVGASGSFGGAPIIPNAGDAAIDDFLKHEATGFGASAYAGGKVVYDWLRGRIGSFAQANQEAQQIEGQYTSQPTTAGGQMLTRAFESNWNPLNWPGVITQQAGRDVGFVANAFGVPSQYSTMLGGATEGGLDVGLAGLGAAGAVRSVGARIAGTTAAEGAAAAAPTGEGTPAASSPQSISAAAVQGGALPQGAPEREGAPVQGGLPEEYQDQRAAILTRVGLGNGRESAIAGDAKDAASDFQMSKFDEPGGQAAAAQFEAERQALTQHTENLIANTGGTIGMDEDALANRGQTIARPFDQLRQWFDQNTSTLYQTADERAQGTPLTNLDGVDQLLQDSQFRNTLLAKDQGGLLSAVGNQLERFRENNPQGFTAAGAEQVRQWLNQVWTPDNKWAVGQLKGAVDNDVLKSAGEDVYQAARAQWQLKAQTLDNPKGISTLFSTDPTTPTNRATPLERIPDKLAQLPIDQFANVIQTLKNMPDEIQPDAQAALGEIRGQLGNKLLQAGTQTAAGSARGLWAADRVSNVLRTNATKFRVAFADDPAAQSAIQDLNSAGQILKVDPSYSGAAAQAANALKRGLLSRALTHAGGAAGAGLGSLVAGPLGAAAGTAVGDAAGASLGASAAERSALRAWQKRVRRLTPPTPTQ